MNADQQEAINYAVLGDFSFVNKLEIAAIKKILKLVLFNNRSWSFLEGIYSPIIKSENKFSGKMTNIKLVRSVICHECEGEGFISCPVCHHESHECQECCGEGEIDVKYEVYSLEEFYDLVDENIASYDIEELHQIYLH